MKYWKGINTKDKQFGTMSDDAVVPDSVLATKQEYDDYIASFPKQKTKKESWDALLNDNQRLEVLWGLREMPK